MVGCIKGPRAILQYRLIILHDLWRGCLISFNSNSGPMKTPSIHMSNLIYLKYVETRRTPSIERETTAFKYLKSAKNRLHSLAVPLPE
jgi:hypothetical protein